MAIQQVSGRCYGRAYYSTTVRLYIANKAAQKLYNKHNVQVVAKYDVRHSRSASTVIALRALIPAVLSPC